MKNGIFSKTGVPSAFSRHGVQFPIEGARLLVSRSLHLVTIGHRLGFFPPTGGLWPPGIPLGSPLLKKLSLFHVTFQIPLSRANFVTLC